MCNKLNQENQWSELEMQKIDLLVSQLKSIMQDNGISQTTVVSILDGKCAKNTILSLFKGDADCRLSTFLMILESCGVELRLETEKSREAILSGDIAEYRATAENLRAELSKAEEEKNQCNARYSELIEKNTLLTDTIAKQQKQIEKYMERMENAENALYSANADMRRKDARIVSLLEKLGKL